MPRFDTRLALMRAAEQLFAQQGVDRVSLREIAIAAGQRNVSAATYHFGSKRELIEAILERHSRPIQNDWVNALKAESPEHKLMLPELAELLVRPIVAKIDDADGGRCYLEICGELVASRSFPLIGMRVASTPGAAELAMRVAQHGPKLPAMLTVLRATRMAGLLYCSIGDYLRLTANGVEIPRDLFVADLVRTLVAVVQAEAPSQATD
ncbi:MAG TPA: helix-turn-helix domain-containing protein [Polyangiaceae bacterium]|nr:helix-turn-helix domain-containing protein [Polyangiaceae bacterium]